MLTAGQHEAFSQDGFLCLQGAVPGAVVCDMYERLWSVLEVKGAKRNDPSTWELRFGFGLHAIRRGDPDPRECPPLRDALDAAFLGSDWCTKPHWGQALVTFPTTDPWILPNSPWHLDHTFLQGERISGLNMFLFVDEVVPHGGGTVVLRSSPQLIARFVKSIDDLRGMKEAEIKKRFFGTHPYLQELTSKPLAPDRNERLMGMDTDVDGISVRVVEFTGKAGDVVLAHPWLLHAISQNTSDRPRLMRASRVYRRDVYDRCMTAGTCQSTRSK